ncbi:uncharacterized protein LOC119188473, partial [Manduca sexta]|uniref:uncharacterized protein LOC119188473 n=1 Tax=Manduca sexta TaxID=7130 RepID=UPI00188FDFA9
TNPVFLFVSDLQFQLIFNKESSPKTSSPAIAEDSENSEEANLKREVSRLEREAAAARGEARAAEARALQLQRLVDAQTEKLRELEVQSKVSCSCSCSEGAEGAAGAGGGAGAESRGELRARLTSAERLVRRLRADAERQRREVHAPAPPAPGGAVTNLLFDGAAARHAHVRQRHGTNDHTSCSITISSPTHYRYIDDYPRSSILQAESLQLNVMINYLYLIVVP